MHLCAIQRVALLAQPGPRSRRAASLPITPGRRPWIPFSQHPFTCTDHQLADFQFRYSGLDLRASHPSPHPRLTDMSVLQQLWDWQHYHFVERVDPRIKIYPLFGPPLGPPWGLFGIVALYVYFVKWLGPRLMRDRKPYDLRNVMIAYNIFQVILSAYNFYESWVAGWGGRYNWFCQPLGPDDYTPMDIRAARCSYLYFFSKIIDLLDTVFIVMRKNYRQLSFLHIYHHAIMVLGVWYGIAYSPGGHVTFVGFLNTFVHTIMYGYYLLTALDPSIKKNIAAKKWITRMQLIQFVGVFVHSAQVFLQPSCPVDRSNMVFLMIQSVIMTTLFSNFYYQSYIKKKEA